MIQMTVYVVGFTPRLNDLAIGGFRGGAEVGGPPPPFFLYFQNVFETLTLLYFASRIRPQCCMLHVLKVKFSFGVGDSAPSF